MDEVSDHVVIHIQCSAMRPMHGGKTNKQTDRRKNGTFIALYFLMPRRINQSYRRYLVSKKIHEESIHLIVVIWSVKKLEELINLIVVIWSVTNLEAKPIHFLCIMKYKYCY